MVRPRVLATLIDRRKAETGSFLTELYRRGAQSPPSDFPLSDAPLPDSLWYDPVFLPLSSTDARPPPPRPVEVVRSFRSLMSWLSTPSIRCSSVCFLFDMCGQGSLALGPPAKR